MAAVSAADSAGWLGVDVITTELCRTPTEADRPCQADRVRAWTLCAIACALLLTGCAAAAPTVPDDLPGVPVLHPQVIAVLPHDRDAFTEGLEIDGGQLYE